MAPNDVWSVVGECIQKHAHRLGLICAQSKATLFLKLIDVSRLGAMLAPLFFRTLIIVK